MITRRVLLQCLKEVGLWFAIIPGVLFWLGVLFTLVFPAAYGQSFDFGTVCAGQVPTGGSIITQCRFNENFLQQSVLPFQLVLGGYLGMVFWAVICVAVYLKYHNAMISLLVGVPVLLTSALAIPDAAQIYIGLLAASAVAVSLFILWWKIPRD